LVQLRIAPQNPKTPNYFRFNLLIHTNELALNPNQFLISQQVLLLR